MLFCKLLDGNRQIVEASSVNLRSSLLDLFPVHRQPSDAISVLEVSVPFGEVDGSLVVRFRGSHFLQLVAREPV